MGGGVPNSVFNKKIRAYSWFDKWNITLIQFVIRLTPIQAPILGMYLHAYDLWIWEINIYVSVYWLMVTICYELPFIDGPSGFHGQYAI